MIHKNLLKKVHLFLLSIITAFTAVLTPLPIKAASYTLNFGAHTGISYSASGPTLEGTNTTDWNANYQYLLINGGVVFCLDPSQLVYDGVGGYTDADFPNELKNQMNLIGLHGYFEHGQTADWYMASQFMMWELRGWTINTTNLANYANMKAEIQNRINHHYDKPNFFNIPVSITVDQTITLTDTNNVLDKFSINPIEGVTFSKNGNQLSITPNINAPDDLTIVLKAYANGDGTESTVVYRIPGMPNQVVGKFNYQDPVALPLNIKVNKYGSLKLIKQDEDGTLVPNTSFNISSNADMSSPIGSYTTGSDGSITNSQLIPGTYYIQEIAVPSHLILDSSVKSVIIKPNETTTYTATNNWIKGYLKVIKRDIDTGKTVTKANTTFSVYKNDGTFVQDITTNGNGMVSTGLLRYSDYYLIEKIAPDGYTHSDQKLTYQIRENGKTYEAVLLNKRVTGTININKEDSITGNKPQGEATLKGAVYELKARTPITDPADGSLLFAKDQVVSTLTTDSEANASIDELYLGDYYLKEKTPSHGYTLDPIEYEISLTYENQNIEVVTKKQTVKERIIAQAFSLIKVNSEETGEANNLQGVEFTIKSKKDIDALGSWENAPISKNAKGENAAILVTDKNGQAVSDELPFGTYVVRETKAPNDHYIVPDFTVVIDQDSRDPQPWRVMNDKKFKAVVAIVKKDIDTGKTIALEGAEFKIKNLDKNEYVGNWVWNPLPHYVDSWTTDKTGQVMTDEVLDPGNYQLEEIKAPEGYTIDPTPIKFTISSNTAYETLPDGVTPVITLLKENKSVKGRINIKKQGEVLSSMDSLLTKLTKQFNYKTVNLENAVFEITANENIYSADNQKDLIYKKGTVVDTITTAKDGTAQSKTLPLGKYLVKEKQAPEGFVGSDLVKDVELTYKDQNTALVYGDAGTYTNDRQKISLEVIKKDADSKTPLSGAQFGLYANEDIKAINGTILIKKGKLIETVTSDNDGKVNFKSDLPLAKYQVKETKAPIGYTSSNAIIDFDASYQGQDVKVIELSSDFENKITTFEFSKVDISNDQELPGAHMVVLDENNQSFDAWISTEKPHIIKGLEAGKTYTLKETSSPYGYAKAQDITFTVQDTGEIQKIKMEDPLVVGKLSFVKTGEAFNATVTGQTEFGKTESPIWNKQNLLGAEVTIYASEDIKIGNTTYFKKDQKIEALESDYEAVQSKELLVGKYYYIETKTPHGYITNTNKHYFEIKDNQNTEVQVFGSTLDNERPSVDIDMTKTLEKQTIFEDGEAYKDIVFGLYAREDIYDYMGNVAIENSTMIGTSGITEDGHLVNTFDLPNGVYFIKELATNSQYKLDPNEYDFEIGYKGGDIANYIVQIGKDGIIDNQLARGSVSIHKVDSFDTEKILKNVEFNISTSEDMNDIIATTQTDDNGIARFDSLELGTYYIQEKIQVDGYVINDHIYKVDITEDGDLIDVTVQNKPTEVEFSKLDDTGTSELPGAILRITEKETGKIIDTWTTSKDTKILNYLTEGKEYVLTEVSAPVGYEIAEPITFIAKDGQKITMQDKLIRSYIDVNKVDFYNKKDILKVAEFTLYRDAACTEEIITVKTNTNNGIARFDDLVFGTYYIKETKAPEGYHLSDEIVKVTINEDWINGDEKRRTIIYPDKPFQDDVINTGDSTSVPCLVLLALISFGGICYFSKKRSKRKE